jgi:hypothetical protein
LYDYDLLVIGSGPGGQKAAIAATKLGKRVCMVERRNMMGGVRVNTGTIPSKTLREAVLYLTGFAQREMHSASYRVKSEITIADLLTRTQHVVGREVDVIRSQLLRNHVDLLGGSDRSDFFGSQVTNEIPLARTHGGGGQQPGTAPGQLPLGMVPLPDALKTQTIAAAATIEAQAGKTATITTTLSSGAHSLVAVFTPTDPRSFSGSVSLPVSYVVNAARGPVATTTTLTGSPSPAVPIILRATVVPASAVSTVEFTDGTTALGGPVPVIGGVAAVFTPVLTPGPHSLIATFTPTDPTAFGPSSSAPMSVLVTAQSGQISTLLHNLLQSLLAGLHL